MMRGWWLAATLCSGARAQDLFLPEGSPNEGLRSLGASWQKTISLRSQPTLCWDLAGGITTPGTAIDFWECNGQPNQVWIFDAGAGVIRYGADPSKCIDGGDTVQGSLLQLWDCNGRPQQQWGYDGNMGTIYLSHSSVATADGIFGNVTSGASLCVDGFQNAQQSARIQLWQCNGAPQQAFNVFWGTTIRVGWDYKMCLDVAGGQAQKGAALQVWECNGHANQYWIHSYNGGPLMYGGNYGNPQLCVDSHDMSAGTKLILWDCNGQSQQMWGYEDSQKTIYLAKSSQSNSGASLCMDLSGGTFQKGTAPIIWGCNSCWNQQWILSHNHNGAAKDVGWSSDAGRLRGVVQTPLRRLDPSAKPLASNMSLSSCPPTPAPPPPPTPPAPMMPRCQPGQVATAKWPKFDNQAQLQADSQWSAYFKKVWGEVPSTGYPICIGNFDYLYTNVLKEVGLHPRMVMLCPTKAGDYYHHMQPLMMSPFESWIFNPANRKKGLPGNTWVEVVHTSFSVDGTAGAWYYYAPGSGIWLNLGNTRAYRDHPGAVHDILGEICLDTECVSYFPRLFTTARLKGITTVQFYEHHDCGTCDFALCQVEIVDTAGSGINNCGVSVAGQNHFRVGWNADKTCDCDPGSKYANCRGYGTSR